MGLMSLSGPSRQRTGAPLQRLLLLGTFPLVLRAQHANVMLKRIRTRSRPLIAHPLLARQHSHTHRRLMHVCS